MVHLLHLVITGGFRTINEVSDGLVRMPALWDPTFASRKIQPVTGFVSGLREGGKAMAMGIFDGSKDLVMKPVEFGKEEGAGGAFRGSLIGIGNFIVKPFAGTLRGVTLVGKGVFREGIKHVGKRAPSPTKQLIAGVGQPDDWREMARQLTGYEIDVCKKIVADVLAIPTKRRK